jgi:hypothetical protein
VELAAAFHPELVLLDIDLPKLNDYDDSRPCDDRKRQVVAILCPIGEGRFWDRYGSLSRASHKAECQFETFGLTRPDGSIEMERGGERRESLSGQSRHKLLSGRD